MLGVLLRISRRQFGASTATSSRKSTLKNDWAEVTLGKVCIKRAKCSGSLKKECSRQTPAGPRRWSVQLTCPSGGLLHAMNQVRFLPAASLRSRPGRGRSLMAASSPSSTNRSGLPCGPTACPGGNGLLGREPGWKSNPSFQSCWTTIRKSIGKAGP